jgi:hypothetical protein
MRAAGLDADEPEDGTSTGAADAGSSERGDVARERRVPGELLEVLAEKLLAAGAKITLRLR